MYISCKLIPSKNNVTTMFFWKAKITYNENEFLKYIGIIVESLQKCFSMEISMEWGWNCRPIIEFGEGWQGAKNC